METVASETTPAATSFSSLSLSPWICESLDRVRITSPTKIQTLCIPPILRKKNVVGCAYTGSGKTLSFALPIIQNLAQDPYGIFALVVTPTRELAFQVLRRTHAERGR